GHVAAGDAGVRWRVAGEVVVGRIVGAGAIRRHGHDPRLAAVRGQRAAGLSAVPRYARGFDTAAAWDHLQRRDRRLGAWMKRIGVIGAGPRWRARFDPVDALARAILFQQLSGKAASTIVGRVETAIGSARLHADTLGRIDDAALRACGVSGNKALALRDLASREARGEIPTLRQMSTMHHDDIVAA